MKESLQKQPCTEEKKERKIQEHAHITLGGHVIGGNVLVISIYTLQ